MNDEEKSSSSLLYKISVIAGLVAAIATVIGALHQIGFFGGGGGEREIGLPTNATWNTPKDTDSTSIPNSNKRTDSLPKVNSTDLTGADSYFSTTLFSSDSVCLFPGECINLDSGKVACNSDVDFEWSTDSRSLIPKEGVSVCRVGFKNFSEYYLLRASNLQSLEFSEDTVNYPLEGELLVIKTSRATICKLHIISIFPNLTLRMTTFLSRMP